MWLNLFSNESLKKQVGLRYISHMWSDYPSWYLWLNDCQGVYKLELQAAQKIEDYDWLAEFTIKYYPSKEEDAYNGLSILEKLCRESEVFDSHPAEGHGSCPCHSLQSEVSGDRFKDLSHGTGVPSHRYSDIIPADFFYAGHLFVAFKEGTGSLIRVKSQTKWQITMTEDFAAADHRGDAIAVLKKGEIDRNYPGFEICNFFYRRFTRSWALFNQYSHHQERVWKGDGLNFFSDGQSLWPKPSLDIQKIITQTALRFRPEDILPSLADEDIAYMYSKID